MELVDERMGTSFGCGCEAQEGGIVLATTMVRVNPYGSSKKKLGTILDSFWTTPTLHLLDW
eukprot:scaffold12514_cov145-Amphora_coffeaeformis.AAC.4